MKTGNKILIVSAMAASAGLGVYGAGCLIDEMLFNRKMVPSPQLTQKISGCDNSHLGDFLQKNLQWVEDYGYEKHYIISDRGQKLTGCLMKAEKDSDIFVFCAHGYRSYGKKEFCGVAQYYLKKGYNVFFPDHVASGESEGTHCTFGYCETEDSIKWLSYLTDNFGKDIKILLHGVSMGAATVMMMSERKELPENVKAVIADCGFSSATDFFSFKLKSMGIPPKHMIKVVNYANKRRLGFDFNRLNPVDSVRNSTLPMMFIHGDKDALVPCYMATELYESCGSEKKEIYIVEGADHAQSFMVGGDTYESRMDEFLKDLF